MFPSQETRKEKERGRRTVWLNRQKSQSFCLKLMKDRIATRRRTANASRRHTRLAFFTVFHNTSHPRNWLFRQIGGNSGKLHTARPLSWLVSRGSTSFLMKGPRLPPRFVITVELTTHIRLFYQLFRTFHPPHHQRNQSLVLFISDSFESFCCTKQETQNHWLSPRWGAIFSSKVSRSKAISRWKAIKTCCSPAWHVSCGNFSTSMWAA